MRAVPTVLLAAWSACDLPPTHRDVVPAAILAEYVGQTGLTFADCGSTDLGQCDGVPADAVALADCLAAALPACTPVRGTQARATVEGDPILTTFFLVGTPDACTVVVFTDSTRDAFGSPTVVRQDCERLATDDATCPTIEVSGCVAIRTWR